MFYTMLKYKKNIFTYINNFRCSGYWLQQGCLYNSLKTPVKSCFKSLSRNLMWIKKPIQICDMTSGWWTLVLFGSRGCVHDLSYSYCVLFWKLLYALSVSGSVGPPIVSVHSHHRGCNIEMKFGLWIYHNKM